MIRISAVTVYYVIMKEYDILSFMDLIDWKVNSANATAP